MRKVKNAVTALMAALFMCSTAVPLYPAAAYDACDVNHDGSVDISDVICINQHLSGERAYKNYNQLDANKSHTVDATDANCVMAKVIKNSYSAYYIRRNSSGNPITVNMPAISSTITLDSSVNDTSGRWYVGYSYLNHAPISRYKLTPNTMTLNASNNTSTRGSLNGEDNRVISLGEENTGIVYINGATGFIVGDHQIATAAHVVDKPKSPATNYIRTDMNIKTYNSNGTLTGKSLTVAEVHMTEVQAKSLSGEGSFSHVYDYALITVKEDLSDYVHFDIGNAYNMTNSEAGAIPIYVTGRPSNTGEGSDSVNGGGTPNSTDALYTHNGSVYGSDNRSLLHYAVDATGGQSGSPVYTITREHYNNEFYYIYTALAVHSGGSDPCCLGPLMTKHQMMFYNNNPNAHYQ